jgi:hypothetical protein
MQARQTLAAFWIGLRRPAAGQPYALLDGTATSQTPSSDSAYAHWSRLQRQYAALAASHCVRAANDTAYDIYVGDSSTAQLGSAGYYLQSSNSKFAWQGVDCNGVYQYVCELPAAAFSCPSPPAPLAPEPPPPPPPPSPEQVSQQPFAPVVSPACE